MKPASLLLAASLTANAALLVLFVAGAFDDNSSGAANPAPSAATPTKAATPLTSPDAWSALQPDHLPHLAERLRAAGFPPAVIRAMLAEQVKAQFAARRATLLREAPPRRFWEPVATDARTAVALAKLDQEERQALQSLLGPEIALDDPIFQDLRRQLPGFPTEKVLALHRLRETHMEKRQELFSSGAFLGTAARDTVEKEQRAEIARLLSPEELEEYDLRTGTTASNLRFRLSGVELTEQEFRSLHRLQQAFNDQHGQLALIDLPPDQRSAILRQRSEAQRQLEAQFKATLGDQRYADYLRANESGFQQTSQLVARLGLPSATLDQIQALEKDLQARAIAVRSNSTLASEDHNAQLDALAAEAKSRLSALLGPQGFDAYTLTGGAWLRQFQIRAAAGRPTGARGGGG